jgi:hypothetical protein
VAEELPGRVRRGAEGSPGSLVPVGPGRIKDTRQFLSGGSMKPHSLNGRPLVVRARR